MAIFPSIYAIDPQILVAPSIAAVMHPNIRAVNIHDIQNTNERCMINLLLRYCQKKNGTQGAKVQLN